MTINAPASLLLLLYELVAEGQGVAASAAARHGAERHPEGVHRPRELHLPAAAVDAADDGSVRVLRGADPDLEHDLDLRIPHPRGGLDCGAGAGVHARERDRLRDAAVAAGLSPDDFGERLSFFFNAHNDFFQEVAKFRAARRLWARIMRDRFGATNPKAQALRFHAQTGGSTLTAQQPENNIVRVAVQALSAVCGGAQSLHTNSYDEALALPSEHAATIALRTQQVLQHEAGTTATADPLGGSYYIEALTDELDRRATELIERGARSRRCSRRRRAAASCRARSKAPPTAGRETSKSGDRVIIGVNRYAAETEAPIELHGSTPTANAASGAHRPSPRAAEPGCRDGGARPGA